MGRDRKTGFCLNDAYETKALNRVPRWTGECARGQPGAQHVREGISPGFGDDYVPAKEGQSIDVTGAARRAATSSSTGTNPDHVLRERSYANNAASVLIELRGARVRILAPLPRAPRAAEPDGGDGCNVGNPKEESMRKLVVSRGTRRTRRRTGGASEGTQPRARREAVGHHRRQGVAGDDHGDARQAAGRRQVADGPARQQQLGQHLEPRRQHRRAGDDEDGRLRARVVFPSAGTWRVTVIDAMTGRAYAFGTTRVLPTT